MSDEKKNRVHTPEFKASVVLELIRGDVSLSQASSKYGIRDQMLSRWKKEFLERSCTVFGGVSVSNDQERRISELESLFKEQSLELAILKKALALSRKGKGSDS